MVCRYQISQYSGRAGLEELREGGKIVAAFGFHEWRLLGCTKLGINCHFSKIGYSDSYFLCLLGSVLGSNIDLWVVLWASFFGVVFPLWCCPSLSLVWII